MMNLEPLLFKDINVRETLQKIHTEFPNLTLDELFKILDCITLYPKLKEESNIYVR